MAGTIARMSLLLKRGRVGSDQRLGICTSYVYDMSACIPVECACFGGRVRKT